MAIEVELRGTYFGNAPLHSLCRELCKIAFSSKFSMIPTRYHWENILKKGGHFEKKNACKIKKKQNSYSSKNFIFQNAYRLHVFDYAL
jgi:hypothetical protein